MSYARFGEADIYVFEDIRGGWTCQWCCLLSGPAEMVEDPDAPLGFYVNGIEDFNSATLAGLKEHLEAHVAAGHDVGEALERVMEEMAEASA